MRILLVEDNQALADGLSAILRGTGHAVDVVNDGASADAAISAEAFDLVILDLTLPDMDGLEVLRRVGGEAPGWLAPEGRLLVEVSGRQCERAVEVLAAGGLEARAVRSARWDSCVVVGRRSRVHG